MTGQKRQKILALVLGLGLFFSLGEPAFAAYGTQQPPKLMNLYFDWQIPDSDLANLAKWDVVVLDMDQQARYPDRIRKLRQQNPKIKILAYIDSTGIAAARFVEEPNYPGYALAHAIPDAWYLHRGNDRVGFWPGAWTINVADASPKNAQGEQWADFLPRFIQENMWSSGLWDGVFLDDALPGATWFVGSGLDVNGDGKAEDDATVNASWARGWTKLAANLRTRLGKSALIMGNGSAQYANVTNGILFENFPSNGWAATYKDFSSSVLKNQSPSISAINASANNVNNPASYKSMRFGLGSAMLGDGYFSYDFGSRDHGQTWWYDEYDASIGKTDGSAVALLPTNAKGIVNGVWWRPYERGGVIVNSSGAEQRIALDGDYERLRGAQDPAANNGAIESVVTIGSQDALLLIRRAQASSIGRTSAFQNGSFVRVYDANGRQAQAGFFIQRTSAAGGSTVLVDDVDRDGKLDTVSASDGTVRIAYGKGGSSSLSICGKTKGETSIAAGNADRDASDELVVGCPGSARAKIVELDGGVRAAWDAYMPAFRGGVRVAIGDLDADGMREIVTGAGATGGPQVRVFKTDGSLKFNGFFAFDKRERGGVSIAVGDVNGDGKDEIIAGSGEGSIPRVRIFRGDGTLIREFALGSSPSSSGVSVSLSDVNGDGRMEILASGVSPAG